MGRPKEYRNAAEKQKAYRERIKTQSQEADLAFMLLEHVKLTVDALRKKDGFQLEALYGLGKSPDKGDTPFMVHGYIGHKFVCNVDELVFLYLTKAGLLEPVSRSVSIRRYRIKAAGS